MDEDEEFDDIELDTVALAAVAVGTAHAEGADDNPNDFKALGQFLLRGKGAFRCSPQTLMLHVSGWWTSLLKGVSVDEVKRFLKQMDDEEEFNDIGLDPIALMAIAGGGRGQQLLPEEAHDDQGSLPGMRPMKWLLVLTCHPIAEPVKRTAGKKSTRRAGQRLKEDLFNAF